MGLRARVALDDCYEAICALEGGDVYNWKSLWCFAVGQLRTVGHTLIHNDADRSDRHKAVITAHWEALLQEKSSGHIFWDFILPTRNRLLKEYEGLPTCDAKVYGDDNVEFVDLTLTLEDGSDGLSMIREAADWWDDELGLIEAELDE